MADEPIQRVFRASQSPARNAPSSASAPAAGDPLAELARLIGQSDPFAEFGRDQSRAAQFAAERPAYAPPAQDRFAAAPPVYPDERYAMPAYATPGDDHVVPPMQSAPFPPPPGPPPPTQYDRQGYDPAYPQDAYAQGIVPEEGDQSGYEQGPYFPNEPYSAADDEHLYDDAPPRRRIGVLAIAAVLALAVIGTAGAFGYRMLFGSSGSAAKPPPVIKAEATPSKIVPAAQSKDPTGKSIYDRVNNSQNEKVVSREEQPVDIRDRPVGTVSIQGQGGTPSGATQQASLGTGVIGVEPKKIHTIAIHPGTAPQDQAVQPSPPAPAPVPARAQPAPPSPPPAEQRTVAEAQPRQVARAEPKPVRAVAATPPSNAPLSLNPNSPAPAPAPAAPARPARTAVASTQSAPVQSAPAQSGSVASGSAASGSGGYAVQIVSRHNEADAQASFQSLQSKFPQQLSGRTPVIRRVDLGAKGVYYRALVGPFGSADEASQLCSNLKAAGGDCLVQRI
jgi:hypothetical protein